MAGRLSARVVGVSKQYHRRGGLRGLQERVGALTSRLAGRVPSSGADLFYAVRDISFDVAPGEAFGIIGHNGAGKTTMLRLLSGITVPSAGTIDLPGRLAAIIELGAGFHPELSGRENIHLYAAIMGMQARQVRAGFDEIVAFSELEEFLDMPVKHYSSGMYVRLAFSVASAMHPDVLLIDEVLAVGDAAFQTKSLRRIRELKDAGTAIVFVSHNLHQIRVLCDRALLLSHGQIQALGVPDDVIAAYFASMRSRDSELAANVGAADETTDAGSAVVGARIRSVALIDSRGQTRSDFCTGEPLHLQIAYHAFERISDPAFTVAFYSIDGTLYTGHQSTFDGFHVHEIFGDGMIEVIYQELGLIPGTYQISVSISDRDGMSKYDWHQKRYLLFVLPGSKTVGLFHHAHSWGHAENGASASKRIADSHTPGREQV